MRTIVLEERRACGTDAQVSKVGNLRAAGQTGYSLQRKQPSHRKGAYRAAPRAA